MTQDEIKERRKTLQKIYEDHDIEGFRLFLQVISKEQPGVSAYLDLPAEQLSEIMYSEKARYVYLGDSWQQARNHIRTKQFWGAYTSPATLPLCVECSYFRTAPEGEEPCLRLGAVPGDVACQAYNPLKQNS